MPMFETINWRPVAEGVLPDADLTVLVTTEANDEPVWLGFYADGQWFDTDATPITVTHWAEMPAGATATA
jgi:hypothetical protein